MYIPGSYLVDLCCVVLCLVFSGSLSYSQHAAVMQKLFEDLGVDATKLTHELRIFAAQLLYEMGVPLEVGVGFVRVHMVKGLRIGESVPISFKSRGGGKEQCRVWSRVGPWMGWGVGMC